MVDVGIPPSGLVNRLIRRLLDPVIARVEDVEGLVGGTTTYLGKQTAPVSAAAIQDNTYVIKALGPASRKYDVIAIEVFGINGGGTLRVFPGYQGTSEGISGFAIREGFSVIDIEIVDGLQTLVGGVDYALFSLEVGEYPFFYAYDGAGIIGNTTGTPEGAYEFRNTSGFDTAFVDGASTTSQRPEIRFHVRTSTLSALEDQANELEATVEAATTKSLTLTNSDSVMVFGDSVTDGIYMQPGKSWVAEASAGTDWRLETFAGSGFTIENILTRIRAGTVLSGNGVSVAAYRSTTAIIALGINDDGADTIATYQDNMRIIVETLRGIGYRRIALLAPHVGLYGDAGGPAITRALASELGCDFIDVYRQRARMIDFDNRYVEFWSGASHPGVRTKELYRVPVEEWVRSLGRPRTGLKLFKKRPGVTITDPEDGNYWDLYDRERLWQEIAIGGVGLSGGGLNFYDELDGGGGSVTFSDIDSAYGAIIAAVSTPITAGNWGLIEAILPFTAQNLTSVKLTLTGPTGVTVYVRDALGTAESAGAPSGPLTTVTVSADGTYTISQAVLLKAMDGDKLPIWIFKSGDVSVTAIQVDYVPTSAAVEKRALPAPVVPVALGAELLGETLVDGAALTASWTVTGTVTATASVPGGDLPPVTAATEVAPVDNTNYIAQAVTWSAENFETQEMVVSVVAGRFPALFVNSSTYPDDAPITADTFDYAKLVVELIYTGPDPDIVIPLTAKVGLWWEEPRWLAIAPPATTGCTVRIRSADSKIIYIAKGSVKMVAA